MQGYNLTFSFIFVVASLVFAAGFAASVMLSLFLRPIKAYFFALPITVLFLSIILGNKLLALGLINLQARFISSVYLAMVIIAMFAGLYIGVPVRIFAERLAQSLNKQSKKEKIKWIIFLVTLSSFIYDLYYIFLKPR